MLLICPGTIFSFINKKTKEFEIAICKSKIDDRYLEVALISLTIFEIPAETQILDLNHIESIDIRKELVTEFSINSDWTHITIYNKNNIKCWNSLFSEKPDWFYDDLKANYYITDYRELTTGEQKFIRLAVCAEFIEVKRYLEVREWKYE